MLYDLIPKHKETECPKTDFKELYFNLKQKTDEEIKELKAKYEKEIQKLKQNNNSNNNNNDVKSSFFVKTSAHLHPVESLRRFGNLWYCDVCHKTFKEEIPSYHCTLCDFDICYKCVKNKITHGNILRKMEDCYKDL